MPSRVSIKKMMAFLKIGGRGTLIPVVFLFTAAWVFAADSLTEIQVPDALSPGLKHLINLADPTLKESFQPDKIDKLLKYTLEPKNLESMYFADPELGSPSGYYEFDIQCGFEHLLKYTFAPDIPGFLMTPSTTRLSRWEQVQGWDRRLPALWIDLDKLDKPIIVNGVEFVENTPDIVSGAYYGYRLYRTLVLFKADGHNVIISISRQKGISDVGKKGYVLGSDDDWDYFYSGEPGMTIPGLGWVKSHMYDSYGVSIYYEMEAAAPLLRCGVYKWVRAGWSRINAVKKHHIHDGMKRFAGTFKKIMEYSALPDMFEFERTYAKIRALTENELLDGMKIYLGILEKRYGRDYRPPRAWSPEVFKDKSPWFQMSAEAMHSVMMLEYLKSVMGKADAKWVGVFLGP